MANPNRVEFPKSIGSKRNFMSLNVYLNRENIFIAEVSKVKGCFSESLVAQEYKFVVILLFP